MSTDLESTDPTTDPTAGPPAAASDAASTTRSTDRSRGAPDSVLRSVVRSRRGVIGIVILVTMVVSSLLAPWIMPYDPSAQSLTEALQGPSWEHWLGTDDFGRDMLTRIVYGARVTLLSGVLAVAGSLLIGGLLGAIAGYEGGRVDNAIMRVMDVLLALPTLLLAIAIIAALGGGLFNMLIAIGLAQLPIYARTVRGEVLKIRELEFIEVVRSMGASKPYIVRVHVIPNVTSVVLVRVTMGMAGVVIAAAGLSFIGLGVTPPTPEWGSMLNSGRPYLRTNSHLTLYPGVAIMLAVFALSFIGDALRDAMDPMSAARPAKRTRRLPWRRRRSAAERADVRGRLQPEHLESR